MTETIVNSVLGRLCESTIKEVASLYSLDDEVEWMKRELSRIRYFLKDAATKSKRNNRVKHWIREVRNVAYSIEDAIDTFLMEVDESEEIEPGFFNRVKRVKKSLEDLPARLKLSAEINKIRELIREISESRNNYGIQALDEGRVEEVRRPVRRPVLPQVGNTKVVGLETHTKNIIESLVDSRTLRRDVTSIVGPGGIGKTTLAQKAYKSMVDNYHFEYHIWLSVSQEFKLIELLKKMLTKHRPIEPNENLEGEEYFMTEIYQFLEMKKYLIVLDDVWTEDLWCQLEATLPDANKGSRVLMTTRNKDVASAASYSKPYELPFLNQEESEELLLMKAFQYQDPNEPCFIDLLDLAKKFAKKCDGLPLALVVVGGLLSKREADYTEWKKALNNINWKECTDILASSYDDLPVELKSCFMYFACFPEDYEIPSDAIIKMWVSEGFIPQEVGKTMEDIAASYLDELVQRCMIQAIGEIDEMIYHLVYSHKYLRIHDLLRDIAIHDAMEESNLAILSKEGVRQTTKGASHRATVLRDCNVELMEYTGPNLRSLLFFHNSKLQPEYSRFRLLKVLSLMNVVFTDEAKLDWLKELIHLRYLASIHCKKMPKLPDDIEHCKNLQTLHILGGNRFDLPESLWSIKALRHIIIEYTGGDGKRGPPASADLTNLLTLVGVMVCESWITGLPHVTNLRTLHLSNLNEPNTPWDIIANLLCGLNHLTSLILQGNLFTMDILDTRKFPSYKNIQFLKLEGDWSPSVAFDARMFPLYLTELILTCSYLEQDPMPELKKLVSLRALVLDMAYEGNQMTCSAGGFYRLQSLWINSYELLDWRIEENSMPKLNKLKLSHCTMMPRLPNLQHVPTLHKLELIGMPSHIIPSVGNEEYHKIEHIPVIKIVDSV